MAAGTLSIWILPNLKKASLKTVKLLRRERFDVLFLNLRSDMEDSVRELAEGVPYSQFIEHIKELKLIREPISSWEYWFKPILTYLRGIINRRPKLKVWCYKQPLLSSFSSEVAEKISMLTFRVNSTGRVNLSEWKRLLEEYIRLSGDALNDEANYITERFNSESSGICISNFEGRILAERLRGEKLRVNINYVLAPYHFTPLEILMRMLMFEDGRVDDHTVSTFVNLHAKFIREYILTSEDYDTAYMRWVRDKAGWIGSRIQEAYNG